MAAVLRRSCIHFTSMQQNNASMLLLQLRLWLFGCLRPLKLHNGPKWLERASRTAARMYFHVSGLNVLVLVAEVLMAAIVKQQHTKRKATTIKIVYGVPDDASSPLYMYMHKHR